MIWLDSYKKELAELKESIKLKNKILVQHRDVDGSCSAVQFLKFFPDFKVFSIKDPFIPEDIIIELAEAKPELLIFVDVGVDEHLDRILRIKDSLPNSKIFLIDHHVIQNDLNKNSIFHINPRFEDPERYIPASLMIFDILKHLGFDNKKDSWISCIGLISDYGHKDNKEFVKECEKLYPSLLDAKELIDSRLGDSAKTIYSGITLKGEYGVKKVVDILVKSNKFEEFENNKQLKEWRKKVDKEIENVVKAFDENKESYGNLIFFEINSRLNLASIISNIVAENHKDKTIVISKKSQDGWKISVRGARNGSKNANLAEIVKKAVDGIGYGGGHPQAAGAFTDNWDEFKKRLVKLINL